jgi:hypothetical protein
MKTQTTTQKDSNNSNARVLEQHKKIQIAIQEDPNPIVQEDPSSNANGPNNNARKTNQARGAKQGKKNSTYKLTKL